MCILLYLKLVRNPNEMPIVESKQYFYRTFLVLLLLCVSSRTATQNVVMTGNVMASATGTLTRVSSVKGGDVAMPCNTRPTLNNDSLLLVVWYRDDNPVYSYDTRVSGPSAHWIEDTFAGRAWWVNTPEPSLRLKDVQSKDKATYRCRVDFEVSPTLNYKIALDVVEPPSKPNIFDEYGKEVLGAAGPYNEGEDIKLICRVDGGNPTPVVYWTQGDSIISSLSSDEYQTTEGRTLPLILKNASRHHISNVYTCAANNTVNIVPEKTSVKLNLYLRPQTVEILSREQPLSVGRKAELWCRSTGARPPATITWWLGGQLIKSITKQRSSEEGETQSLLEWTPLKEHNRQVLSCKAEHFKFNRSTIETKLPLNVYYVPVSKIHLGAKLNPNDIEEGDDVYFGCEVDANPPAYKIVWEHNGVQLQNNPSNGVILTGNTNLALRNVSRLQAGKYTCTASNVEGDGKSHSLHLQIVYRPLCRKKEIKIIGAALQEQTSIVCEVDGFPPPDTFEWTLNNSAGSIKVDPDRYTIEAKEGKSVLTYTPVSDVDYGTLSCRSTNLAGQQMSPCRYTVLPATRPDPPTNCTVYNLTHDSLDLLCLSGYEGGLYCVYVAEIWGSEGLVVNATTETPLWNFRRLGAKKKFKVVVYAANARGRSEHVSFSLETAPRLAPRIEAQSAWEVNWALGGVLSVAGLIAVILCFGLITTKLRHRARDYEVTLPSSKNQIAVLPKRNSPVGGDDRNPDIIPYSKGVVECPPNLPQYCAVAASPTTKSSASMHSLARLHASGAPMSSRSHYVEAQNEYSRNLVNGTGAARAHREVVTTRTPLLAGHQESCV